MKCWQFCCPHDGASRSILTILWRLCYAGLLKLKQLKTLRLIGDGGNFQPNFLADIGKNLQQLTCLDVSHNNQGLSIKNLASLTALPSLKAVNLAGFTLHLEELAVLETLPIQVSAMVLQLSAEDEVEQTAAWLKRASSTLEHITIGAKEV